MIFGKTEESIEELHEGMRDTYPSPIKRFKKGLPGDDDIVRIAKAGQSLKRPERQISSGEPVKTIRDEVNKDGKSGVTKMVEPSPTNNKREDLLKFPNKKSGDDLPW